VRHELTRLSNEFETAPQLSHPLDRFIAAINDGRLPPELAVGRDGGADVSLEDHRSEDFVPPPYVAFGGASSSLGGGSAAIPSAAIVRGGPTSGAAAAAVKPVDASQPLTTLQVKLLDGRKEKLQ
jgi:hypothetical protein